MLQLHPGIPPARLRHVLRAKGLRWRRSAHVWRGQRPATAPAIQRALAEAIRKGIAIVNVTQCFGGRVDMGLYDTGAQLRELGLIGGGDMPPEAAVTKLQVVGMTSDTSEIREHMQSNWAGERISFPLNPRGISPNR